MTRLPTGTVTLLLSDVAASSAHWQASHGATELAMQTLSDCITGHVAAAGGHVVKARGEGDSHFAVFEAPSAGLKAAAAVQRCVNASMEVRVRVAVTMAELEPRDGDYIALAVNRAARIRGAAHGGQIICTGAIAEVAQPVEGLELRSLGLHRVRDFAAPVELFQVFGEGLPASFPPLTTLDNATSALMAVTYVDEVGSVSRANASDLASWQGPLYRSLRDAANAYDGRHLKLVGDGGVVAFEDPHVAVEFARAVCALPDFQFRAGVAVGLVTLVEGELTGVPFYEAAMCSKDAAKGDVVLTPMMRELVGVG